MEEGGPPDSSHGLSRTEASSFIPGWLTALAEAWEAYLHGSYPIGACVVDEAGQVLARGRNRLAERRQVEGGVIGGHDLAHAEVNALLGLRSIPRPECYGWTVLTTVEPCPQCAGAIAMSGIRGVAYAAPDPWGGCVRLLTDDPYVARKNMGVSRAPEAVQRAALRLLLVGFLEEGHAQEGRFLQTFASHRADFRAALDLHQAGTLARLKAGRAGLAAALSELLGPVAPAELLAGAARVPVSGARPARLTPAPIKNLSPSPDRIGRACAWIEREDGFVLMAGLEWGGWTLPGGGIHPGESGEQAAVREAWEEVGARGEVTGEGVTIHGLSGVDAICYPLRLLDLEPSPEGRPVAWVNPRSLPWAADHQLRQMLAARGQMPAHQAVPALVAQGQARAAELGFDRSCSPETGRLLRTLAAMRPGGRLLELGSGAGVGAGWLLAGMNASARLLTVESDAQRIWGAWEVLRNDPRVEVLYGDWAEMLPHGPFDLIFADCAPAKAPAQLDRLVEALSLGGVLVLDNFTPPARLSEGFHAGDPLRDALFAHPRLNAVEVQVNRAEQVILATRSA